MSLPVLVPGSLYITLNARGDTVDNEFHWAIYLHVSNPPTSSGATSRLLGAGMKYHIRNLGAGWIAEHGQISNALNQFLLIGMLRIASEVDAERRRAVDRIVAGMGHTEEGVTCRTWVLGVLQQLAEEGIVNPKGENTLQLTKLEQEAKLFGASYLRGAIDNIQPRVVKDSAICQL